MVSPKYLAREPHLVTRVLRNFLWSVGARLRKTLTVATRQGQLTVSTSDQAIGRQLYIRREFESEWTAAALAFLRGLGKLPPPGQGTVLDIGANIGVISIGLLHNAEFKKAIAVEPDPQNFRLLEHNARQNHFSAERYVCLPFAASDHEGEAEFELSQDNFGDHRVRTGFDAPSDEPNTDERFRESGRGTIRVKVDSLDHMIDGLGADVADDIAVAWVDTQGHEGFVFAGARELFSKDIPVISELWPYGIKRSGMDQRQFCEIAAGLWGDYWVCEEEEFVRRPIDALDTLFDELGDEGDFDNVIFTK